MLEMFSLIKFKNDFDVHKFMANSIYIFSCGFSIECKLKQINTLNNNYRRQIYYILA